MKKSQLIFASLSAALLAAGCGGGGGSNGGGINYPTAAVQITSLNASTVASGATSSSKNMAETGSSGASNVTGAVAHDRHARSVLEITLEQFNRARSLPFPQATVAGAIQSATVSCASGSPVAAGTPNSFTMSVNDANNNNALDTGDSMSLAFTDCVSGTLTTDGSLGFSIGSFSDTGTSTSAAFTMTYGNFTSVDSASGDTLSINGDITTSFSTTYDPAGPIVLSSSASMTGTSFEMTSSLDGSFLMQNFDITFASTDATIPNYSFSTAMHVSGTGMDGTIDIATPTPFSTPDANLYNGNPNAGLMVVTGGTNTGGTGPSRLRITAQSNGTDVLLEVDEDGDGIYEWSDNTKTWADL